jgi:hypothetical protein
VNSEGFYMADRRHVTERRNAVVYNNDDDDDDDDGNYDDMCMIRLHGLFLHHLTQVSSHFLKMFQNLSHSNVFMYS